MGESIGVRELRQYASTYLARVKEGESITVTERGTPIARLVPIGEAGSDWQREWIEQGRMIPGDRSAPFSWRDLPTFALPPGVGSVDELVEDVRRDRL